MSEPKRILVTGATGFVGKKVVSELLHEGYSVLVLARNSKQVPIEVEGVLNVDLAQLDESAFLDYLIDYRISVVIHLAAVMDFYPKDEWMMRKVNIEATRIIATACARCSFVERFIHISTTEVTGGALSQKAPSNELNDGVPNYVYGDTKKEAEKVVRELGDTKHLKYIILRLTGVFGPKDEFAVFEMAQLINYGVFFFVPGGAPGKAMFTYIDDVVSGIICAISSPHSSLSNTYIICGDEYLTYAEWIRQLALELGRHPPLISLPFPLVKTLMWVLGPILNFGKLRTVCCHPNTVERMREDRWYTNAKAKRDLGFQPKYKLKEAIKITVKDHIASGALKRYKLSPIALMSILSSIFIYILYKWVL